VKIDFNSPVHVALGELLALTCSSNAKLYEQATALGMLNAADIRADGFHYHVQKLDLRQDLSYAKRNSHKAGQWRLKLADCRLLSSARLNFSVRLVPIAYQATAQPIGTLEYGLLAVAQELCSGLMRFEVVRAGFTSRDDLCEINPIELLPFVIETITFPRLKLATLHFPKIPYSSSSDVKKLGLVAGWLGYVQPVDYQDTLNDEISKFAEACRCNGNWGGLSHILQPSEKDDWFFADFPSMKSGQVLNLSIPCGKSWRLRTVTNELRKRVDQWNFSTQRTTSPPALNIWNAKNVFYKIKKNQ
jgi:hypothetical protein